MAVTVGVAACGGSDSGTPEAAPSVTEPNSETTKAASTTVAIKDFKFEPADVSVAAGESVRWENADQFLHTVTSGDTSGEVNKPDGKFDKPMDGTGKTATVSFDEPGTYSYYCKQHNAMNGTVTVR